MTAVEFRRRQIEEAGLVLVYKPAALLGNDPIFSGNPGRRADARGLTFDYGKRVAGLRRYDRWHAAFENAGLLGRDFGNRAAQILCMVVGNRRNHGDKRAFDYVGGIESSAEPHFEEQHIGWVPGEQDEARGRLDLENRDRGARVCGFAFRQRSIKLRIADEPAASSLAKPEPLV